MLKTQPSNGIHVLNSGINNIYRTAPILKEEVEDAVRSLKGGKAAGVDNIPAELLNLQDQSSLECCDSYLPEDMGYQKVAK